ncbi:uncharacterized protein VTP21DRAFT_120 [Calcarisporiella thermophila]|uniref:uncharacterized protein n=1 Tax=Calcarisporiella thermophila TaxID=911321 RepID=UPI003741FFCF
MKTARSTFEGDTFVYSAARERIRLEFSKYKNESDPEVIKKHIQAAEEAATILRRNVVQAVKRDNQSEIYRLRLNKDQHELGDNKTIRMNKGKKPRATKEQMAGCCGGRGSS